MVRRCQSPTYQRFLLYDFLRRIHQLKESCEDYFVWTKSNFYSLGLRDIFLGVSEKRKEALVLRALQTHLFCGLAGTKSRVIPPFWRRNFCGDGIMGYFHFISFSYIILLIVSFFPTGFSRWSFTGLWVTTSLLMSPGLFLVFGPISTLM